jgi:hypothetical protein
MIFAKGIKKRGNNEFFTEDEETSLSIEKMILHVVGSKRVDTMPERDVEGQSFFQGRPSRPPHRRCSCSKIFSALGGSLRRSPHATQLP